MLSCCPYCGPFIFLCKPSFHPSIIHRPNAPSLRLFLHPVLVPSFVVWEDKKLMFLAHLVARCPVSVMSV